MVRGALSGVTGSTGPDTVPSLSPAGPAHGGAAGGAHVGQDDPGLRAVSVLVGVPTCPGGVPLGVPWLVPGMSSGVSWVASWCPQFVPRGPGGVPLGVPGLSPGGLVVSPDCSLGVLVVSPGSSPRVLVVSLVVPWVAPSVLRSFSSSCPPALSPGALLVSPCVCRLSPGVLGLCLGVLVVSPGYPWASSLHPHVVPRCPSGVPIPDPHRAPTRGWCHPPYPILGPRGDAVTSTPHPGTAAQRRC